MVYGSSLMKEIATFIAGFERFQAKYFQEEQGLFLKLRHGQNPSTLVISCCDSRVDPALLTGADPGDLFVVRNVANLVPPYRNAAEDRNGAEVPGIRSAIEFAVKSLEVEHIIVLGHSNCGGIQALMDGEGVTEHQYEFIGAWVSIAKRAKERVLREMAEKSRELQAQACGQAALLISLDNLLSFPWIRKKVEEGNLILHGWYFDIETGQLLAYSAQTATFEPLVSKSFEV